MQSKLHRKSWVSIVAYYVDVWKTSNKWSRETTAEAIVIAYNRTYSNGLPGIKEFSQASDLFRRLSTDACCIFRWLDDITKDRNLLEANFLPVILEAMPEDIRLNCINDLLRPMNVVSQSISAEPVTDTFTLSSVKNLIKEGSDACQAVADLVDGETYDELVKAQQELIELEKSTRDIQLTISKKLAARNVTFMKSGK